jgi:hypothetical protein
MATSTSVTIALSGNLSGAFDMSRYSMGVVHMPAAWTAASLGFKVCAEEGGTYLPLYDETGTLVQISSPAASQSYNLPAELAGCRWVKLWSQNGSGTNTAQAAARTIGLDLKG